AVGNEVRSQTLQRGQVRAALDPAHRTPMSAAGTPCRLRARSTADSRSSRTWSAGLAGAGGPVEDQDPRSCRHGGSFVGAAGAYRRAVRTARLGGRPTTVSLRLLGCVRQGTGPGAATLRS